MTKNEKIVLNNLLKRIDKNSYPSIEEIMNKSINELNEKDIGGLLTIFQQDIYINNLAINELISETLENMDNLGKKQEDYILMCLNIDNYNLKELESFINNQIKLLNTTSPSTTKIKKKNLYKNKI